MSAYRFALVGSGWRAAFYARLARKMPDLFQLTGTWLHRPENTPEWQKKYGGAVAALPEDLLKDRPDFLVVALNKQHAFPYIMSLLEADVPLLLETPPAVEAQHMIALWEAAKNRNAPVFVAEQYPDQPYFSAWKRAVDLGMLGTVSNMSVSMVHGYHAMALIRSFLNVRGENARITGCQHRFPVQKTGDRQGMILDGEIHQPARDQAVVTFDSGKTAFYDFSGEQYHSAIRFSHFGVQGDRGEIFDQRILCLNHQGYPVEEALVRRQRGMLDCSEYRLQGIMLGDRWLYENPYPGVPLGDDEIALAVCMQRMGQMVRGEKTPGRAYYLTEALQDAYMALQMRQAIDTAQTVTIAGAPWQCALKGEEKHV